MCTGELCVTKKVLFDLIKILKPLPAKMPMTTVVISRQLLSWNENDELKESNYITM
jgi:hypothetical protein